MAIKDIIAKGIGFSPGSVKFVPVHGFLAAPVATTTSEQLRVVYRRMHNADDARVTYHREPNEPEE